MTTTPSPAELARSVQERHMQRVRDIAAKFNAAHLTEAQIAARDAELRESTNQAAREMQFIARS